MEIFFYAASPSDSGKYCLQKLLKLSALKQMTILSGESLFLSPLSLKLRSGDLIILFTADTEDLNELVTLQYEFINFRIILILGQSDSETIHKAQFLRPSFITFPGEKLANLEAVIKKTCTDRQYRNYQSNRNY